MGICLLYPGAVISLSFNKIPRVTFQKKKEKERKKKERKEKKRTKGTACVLLPGRGGGDLVSGPSRYYKEKSHNNTKGIYEYKYKGQKISIFTASKLFFHVLRTCLISLILASIYLNH